jgi:hypothetical protein
VTGVVRFELEHLALSEERRLDVRGRWRGVRPGRFARPCMSVQTGGRRLRLRAESSGLDGETWWASFVWPDPAPDVAEIEVGNVVVDVPMARLANSSARPATLPVRRAASGSSTVERPQTQPPLDAVPTDTRAEAAELAARKAREQAHAAEVALEEMRTRAEAAEAAQKALSARAEAAEAGLEERREAQQTLLARAEEAERVARQEAERAEAAERGSRDAQKAARVAAKQAEKAERHATKQAEKAERDAAKRAEQAQRDAARQVERAEKTASAEHAAREAAEQAAREAAERHAAEVAEPLAHTAIARDRAARAAARAPRRAHAMRVGAVEPLHPAHGGARLWAVRVAAGLLTAGLLLAFALTLGMCA